MLATGGGSKSAGMVIADVEVADVIGLYRACSVIRMPPFGRKGYHAFWLTTLLRKFQAVSKLN